MIRGVLHPYSFSLFDSSFLSFFILVYRHSSVLCHHEMHTIGNIDLRTYTGSSFFFFFIYGNFYLGIVKYIAGKVSADLRLSAQARWQSAFTSFLQPPRKLSLPAMIDGPISRLPHSFQRVKHFYFSFLDQCLFLVRKCSGKRFLDLLCAFPCNFFISDPCLWCRNMYCHFNINI